MKKIIKMLSIALISMLFIQCSTTEILPYNYLNNYKQKKNLQEFYDFGNNLSNVSIDKVLFIGDSHVANDVMSDFFRKKLGVYSKFNNFITPDYQLNSALKMEQNGFYRLLLKDSKIGINLTTYASSNEANIHFLNDYIENPNIFINFIDKNSKITIKKDNQIVQTINASNINHWQKINLQINGNFTLDTQGEIYFGGIENNNEKYVDNLGVNGASLSWWNYIDKDLFDMQVKDFNYDIAIISFGTNDAINPYTNINNYKANLTKLIKILKKSNTKILILSPHYSVYYNDGKYIKAPLFDNIKQALMEVAKNEKTMLYDMNAFMENMGGKERMIQMGFSQKDTHLSINGYKQIGIKIFNLIGNKTF